MFYQRQVLILGRESWTREEGVKARGESLGGARSNKKKMGKER